MNSPYVITTSEAKTLRAFGDYTDANVYELASTAQLTPSEIKDAVSHLAGKQLVELKEQGLYVVLTNDGQIVRRSLDPSSMRKRSVSFGHAPAVTVVPDDKNLSTELSSDDLEAALTEAIGNLE